MKSSRQERWDTASAAPVQTLAFLLACSGILALSAYATPPGWWQSQGAVNTNSPNPSAAVNQGQLKQFTVRAVAEMNADLTNAGGAGTALTNLVYGWQQDYATNGYSTNTANPARPYKPSDFTAMNVGQLKYIGNLVWTQLVYAGYAVAKPSWLAQNTATDDVVANLGQLKEVFNFDLTIPANPVSGLTATASNGGEIDLGWTLPAVNNATSFIIQESTDGGATWQTVQTLTNPAATNTAVTGLSVGQSYNFRVGTANQIAPTGTGYTSSSSPTTAPIYAPSGLSVTLAAHNGVTVTWSQSTTTGVTGYTIQQSTDQGQTWNSVGTISGGGTTTTTLSNLSGSLDDSLFQVMASGSSSGSLASSPVTPSASATTDTDIDGVMDNLDGWAGFTDTVQEAKYSPPRIPNPTYAAVTISTIPNNYIIDFVNHQGQAVVHSVTTNADSSTTNVYYFWDKGATDSTKIPLPIPTTFPAAPDPLWGSYVIVSRTPTGLSDSGTVIGYDTMGPTFDSVDFGFEPFTLIANFSQAWRWTSTLSQVQWLADVDSLDEVATAQMSSWGDFATKPIAITSIGGVETIYAFHQHLDTIRREHLHQIRLPPY